MKLIIEVMPGERITDAAKVALRIAFILGIDVEWVFNDRTMHARPEDTLDSVLERCDREINDR